MTDDIDAIREQKREELQRQMEGDGEAGGDAPDEPVHVERADDLARLADDYDVVLADFYADWCGPCQMLEPIVETVAADTDAAVAKVDVDAHQSLAAEYGVRGVPTLVLFSGGEVAEQLVGLQDEATLKRLIEQHS